MREALYIVGAPGAGKTTLSLALRDGWMGLDSRTPIAHTLYPDAGVISLGKDREGFGGTDALGMTAVVPASAWVQEPPEEWDAEYLLAEGDRLAVARFIDALTAGGWHVVIAHLDTPADVAAPRRERRAERLGTELQDAKWVAGRTTKVRNLVGRYAGGADQRVTVVSLGGEAPPLALLPKLARHSHVAASLVGGYHPAPTC